MAFNVDEEKGREAFRYFHNRACKYSNYKLTFDQLLVEVAKPKGAKFVVEGLGLAVNNIGLDSTKLRAAMERVADQGQGRLPANWMDWLNAVKNAGMKITFMEAATFTVTESAKDLAKGAQEVGDAIVTTGKSLLTIMPLALTAAALFIVYRKAKSI